MHKTLLNIAGGVLLCASLAACGSSGNLGHRDTAYHGSPAAPVTHPRFDPFASPGDAPVVWMAPTFDRQGTIVAPTDPSVSWRWEDYSSAEWFRGGAGPRNPPGTF